MSRRTFLAALLGVGASLGLAGLLAPIVRFAYPVVKKEAAANLRVATKSRLDAAGGELDIEYQEVPVALIELDGGPVIGVSRVCTHLGCIIKWDGKGRVFRCPCHAGIFRPTGEVVSGPPPKPLARLVVVERGDEIWVEGWQSA
jgi:cytochrome b6-f complex iron-sulfur subunit